MEQSYPLVQRHVSSQEDYDYGERDGNVFAVQETPSKCYLYDSDDSFSSLQYIQSSTPRRKNKHVQSSESGIQTDCSKSRARFSYVDSDSEPEGRLSQHYENRQTRLNKLPKPNIREASEHAIPAYKTQSILKSNIGLDDDLSTGARPKTKTYVHMGVYTETRQNFAANSHAFGGSSQYKRQYKDTVSFGNSEYEHVLSQDRGATAAPPYIRVHQKHFEHRSVHRQTQPPCPQVKHVRSENFI